MIMDKNVNKKTWRVKVEKVKNVSVKFNFQEKVNEKLRDVTETVHNEVKVELKAVKECINRGYHRRFYHCRYRLEKERNSMIDCGIRKLVTERVWKGMLIIPENREE